MPGSRLVLSYRAFGYHSELRSADYYAEKGIVEVRAARRGSQEGRRNHAFKVAHLALSQLTEGQESALEAIEAAQTACSGRCCCLLTAAQVRVNQVYLCY